MEDLASLGFRINTDGLRRGAGDLDRFGNSSERVDRTSTRLSSRTFPALISVVGVASAALGGLTFGRIISEFASFEQGMRNVAAVSGATAKELTGLSDAALAAASSTRFNPSQTTQALYALASSGQSASEQMASLTNVLNLAEAGSADLGQATELAVAGINQFNLSATEAARVADIFVAAIGASALNVQRLQVALRNAGPTAAALGQSLEATTATLGILTTAFVSGERAGTGFRAILNELPDKAKDLGITIKDAAGNFRPMVDILEDMENQGITATRAISEFGAEAGPSLSVLLTKGSDALRTMETRLQSTGQAADTAAEQMNTLRGDMDAFGSAVDVAFIKIGDAQSTVLRSAIQQTTNLVRLWSGYGDTLGDAAEKTQMISDAVAVAGIVIAGVYGGKVATSLLIATQAQLAYTASVLRGNTVVLGSAIAEEQKALALKTSALAASQKSAANLAVARSENAASVAVLNSVRAEVDLEAVRLRSQMTAQARAATVARLVSARLVLANATRALTASEVVLAEATTVAAAAESTATVTTTAHAAALARTTVTARAAALAMRGLSASMAFLGGPLGILLIAAASAYYFRDALFSTRVELGEAGEAVREYTEGLENMTAATVESNRQSLAQQMRENTIAIAEAGAELDRLREKQKESPMTLKGVPSSATIDVTATENEIKRLTMLGGVLEENFIKLDERAKQLATTAAESSASAAASIAATAEAAASAADKVTAALIVELEYLRIENALVMAGVSATKAEIAIMETKRELMLEAKGLTAAQAVEYVALEKAIKAGIEAQRTEDQMLQNLRDQYGDTTKAVQLFADQAQMLAELFAETGDPELLRMLERLAKAGKDLEGMDVGEKVADGWNDAGRAVNDFAGSVSNSLESLKGLFSEGDKGFKNLTIAVQALNAVQAVNAVLNQSAGDPYTAFGRMAAMIAAVGSLGFSLGSISGGTDTTAADAQAAQGTGSVLGDAAAQSKSIGNAIEITASATEKIVNINTGMLTALQAMQAGISGASNLIARDTPDFAGAPAMLAFDDLISDMLGPLGGLNAIIRNPFKELLGLDFDPLGDFLDKVLGGSSSVTNEGIIIAGGMITDLIDNTVVSAFQDIKSKKSIIHGTKRSRQTEELADGVGNYFSLVFKSMNDAVKAGAQSLGLLPAEIQSRLDQFAIETQEISFKDLNGEDQAEALEAVFSKTFDGLASSVVPFLDDFQKTGEGLGETLARVATQVQLTEEAALALGFALDTAIAPETVARISDSLVELVGGVEAFSNAITSFESNFFTESEQLQINARRLTQAMGDLPLAATRQGFVDLLQAQDVTTISGREAVATLLRLQSSADEYYSFLEEATESLRGSTDNALGDLQRAINDRKSVLQDGYRAEVELIQEQTDVRLQANQMVLDAAKVGMQAIQQELTGITSAANRLRGNFDPAQAGLRSNALATLSSAIASGDLTGTGDAADVASDINAGTYTNSAEYRAEQARTLFTLSLLQNDGETQLSVAEQTVNRLEEQNELIRLDSERQIETAEAALDRELEALDLVYQVQLSQINELRGIREGLSGGLEAIAAALAGLKGAVAIESAVASGGNAGQLQGVAGLFQELLGRSVDQEGAAFFAGNLASGASIEEIRSAILLSEERADFVRTGIPAFADGGMHGGGLRLVGERGPEMEVTGSSKIMSNSELMSSLGGNQKLAAEMKSMHSDMMQGLNVIAKNTNKGSRQLERWDLTGLPAAREFV